VNAHLWEFPNVEITGTKLDAETAFPKLFGVKPKSIHRLRTVKHSITRYRITLEAFSVSLSKRSAKISGRWLAPVEFDSIAFASAHKKLASAAAKSILSGR
jgi:adenine-specific DNA glycosylase